MKIQEINLRKFWIFGEIFTKIKNKLVFINVMRCILREQVHM